MPNFMPSKFPPSKELLPGKKVKLLDGKKVLKKSGKDGVEFVDVSGTKIKKRGFSKKKEVPMEVRRRRPVFHASACGLAMHGGAGPARRHSDGPSCAPRLPRLLAPSRGLDARAASFFFF